MLVPICVCKMHLCAYLSDHTYTHLCKVMSNYVKIGLELLVGVASCALCESACSCFACLDHEARYPNSKFAQSPPLIVLPYPNMAIAASISPDFLLMALAAFVPTPAWICAWI